MRKPRRQETHCLHVLTGKRRGRTGPSSSAQTPATGIGDSTVRPIARDTEQLEVANDELEDPREWTPAKRIRLKSKPLVQSKRPRVTPTGLERMETDELRRMGPGSTANKRKSDQPEEATVKKTEA